MVYPLWGGGWVRLMKKSGKKNTKKLVGSLCFVARQPVGNTSQENRLKYCSGRGYREKLPLGNEKKG